MYSFCVAVDGPPIFAEGVGVLLRGTPWISTVYSVTDPALEKADIGMIFQLPMPDSMAIPRERQLLFADARENVSREIQQGAEAGIRVFLSLHDDAATIRRGIFAAMSNQNYRSPRLKR